MNTDERLRFYQTLARYQPEELLGVGIALPALGRPPALPVSNPAQNLP